MLKQGKNLMPNSLYFTVRSMTCDGQPSESYVVGVSKLVRHSQTDHGDGHRPDYRHSNINDSSASLCLFPFVPSSEELIYCIYFFWLFLFDFFAFSLLSKW